MDQLPITIINLILEFNGYHIWRHGKYVKRIPPSKYLKFSKINQIPIPCKLPHFDSGGQVFIQKKINQPDSRNDIYINTNTKYYKKSSAAYVYIQIQNFTVNNKVIWMMHMDKYYDKYYGELTEFIRDRIQFVYPK